MGATCCTTGHDDAHLVEHPDHPGYAAQLAMGEHGAVGSGKAGYYKEWDSIHAALVSGDVALVKGSWLESFVAGKGKQLPRRQDMPPEALWKVEDLMTDVRDHHRPTPQLLAISYSWLTRQHPDPEGYHLNTYVPLLKHFARQCKIGTDSLAIFIDWCSVPQKPLSQVELGSFQRALRYVDIWYTHLLTEVWLLTKVPEGTTAYEDRGWTKFERALSSLVTPPESVLDLGQVPVSWKSWNQLVKECQAKRRPAETPEAFVVDLQNKVFTYAEDREIVTAKYKDTFYRALAAEEQLWCAGLGWGDREAMELARMLPSCTALKTLELCGNELGPSGASAIIEVLPLCRQLQFLSLDKNQLSPEAQQSVADAWEAAKKSPEGLDLGEQLPRSAIMANPILNNKASSAEQLGQLLARQAAFEARIESAVARVSDGLSEVATTIESATRRPPARPQPGLLSGWSN